ncbi:septum formation initiator [Asanoa sp. NPDC049573]|uniref:septum formation initiator n=1 Tax=Asanoa sp. NPDC049573 TaxID=3155396 RepID=UPI00341FF5CE
MSRRSLAVLGWLAVVIVATLAGVGALRLVGDSLASTPGGVRSQADVARDLAAATARPAPSTGTATPSPTAAPTAAPTTAPATEPGLKSFSSPGGTAFALCVDGVATIKSYSPALGYAVDDLEQGAGREAELKFRGPRGRFEIKIRCDGDEPVRSGHDD